MTPENAAARASVEIKKNPLLRIVAISGPGEPLANPETFETLEIIRDEFDDIAICMSTNGTLLEGKVDWLKQTGVDTITVSMSTANISTASRIYEWARLGDVDLQLRGIYKASNAGIHVKVNSILIPEINMQDILPLAHEICKAGASLQNIVPLVPNDSLASFRTPTIKELSDIRKEASTVMKQFLHCKQCRSDVVGIPGCDTVL